MGQQAISIPLNPGARAEFISHLLSDIQALDHMLERGIIEDGVIRIGAEQEFCLVTDNWRPSKKWAEILSQLNDRHFTSELARYNLEINVDPLIVKDRCFSDMEAALNTYLAKAGEAAECFNDRVILTGILPTISKLELNLDYMTPLPRYQALNNMMRALRGSDFELHIRGIDELTIIHDSVLFEACNTSFQMHLQVSPADFIASYNWAQALAGPILGISANSPLLLGRELWAETRIALFQQSIDTRSSSYALKEQRPRVSFGDGWAQGSITEIFKNDLAGHKVLISCDIQSDSMEDLKEGKIPSLPALTLHNSTIYHWNRACYGVHSGKPHLRIENRYLPSGPTTMDEMANFALWAGLMMGRPREYDHLANCMEFRDAKSNFIKAARTGRESIMRWMGEQIPVRDLILKRLMPIARKGLLDNNVNEGDINHYLGIIEERCAHKTGAQWMIQNYRSLKKEHKKDDALLILTKSIYKNQQTGLAVHHWPPVDLHLEAHEASHLAGHIMSTQLFTVAEDDLADLATSVMLWKDIHHLPVENSRGQLSGLLTWTHMKRHKQKDDNNTAHRLVADIMARDLITVRPETEVKSAIALMKKNEIGCLPVVHDHHLVGIITINDVLPYDHD